LHVQYGKPSAKIGFMNGALIFILLVVAGYIIGSIPSAYLAMRAFTGKDIRSMGTGSATITAVIIHGGKLPGAVGLLGETVKAAFCLLIASLLASESLASEPWPALVILIAAVYASSYSIWLKGNGGQGQTIMVTGIIMINPIMVFVIAACYVFPLLITRRHLISNHLFHILLPISLGLVNWQWEWGLAGILFVLPSVIKQIVVGDEVAHAKKISSIGPNSSGAY